MATAEREVKDLAQEEQVRRSKRRSPEVEQVEADGALKAAEELRRCRRIGPGVTDTVVRQQLELRKSAAEQSSANASNRIDVASDVQKLVMPCRRRRT